MKTTTIWPLFSGQCCSHSRLILRRRSGGGGRSGSGSGGRGKRGGEGGGGGVKYSMAVVAVERSEAPASAATGEVVRRRRVIFIKKLNMDEIHDIHVLRLIVEEKEDCYKALRVITSYGMKCLEDSNKGDAPASIGDHRVTGSLRMKPKPDSDLRPYWRTVSPSITAISKPSSSRTQLERRPISATSLS
nr:hypothetical protein DVA78_20810 [Ipomoea trifida]